MFLFDYDFDDYTKTAWRLRRGDDESNKEYCYKVVAPDGDAVDSDAMIAVFKDGTKWQMTARTVGDVKVDKLAKKQFHLGRHQERWQQQDHR